MDNACDTYVYKKDKRQKKQTTGARACHRQAKNNKSNSSNKSFSLKMATIYCWQPRAVINRSQEGTLLLLLPLKDKKSICKRDKREQRTKMKRKEEGNEKDLKPCYTFADWILVNYVLIRALLMNVMGESSKNRQRKPSTYSFIFHSTPSTARANTACIIIKDNLTQFETYLDIVCAIS